MINASALIRIFKYEIIKVSCFLLIFLFSLFYVMNENYRINNINKTKKLIEVRKDDQALEKVLPQ
jgi:hypothetical protein